MFTHSNDDAILI